MCHFLLIHEGRPRGRAAKQEWITSIAHLNGQIVVSPRSTYKCVNKTGLKIANSYCRRIVST